ncbi:hypothetical protein GCM10017576_23460 [Microbacterium barkeri]|uniref:Uncharacterized protein n=1 Tax=Microbacterium barkeri TaxID=33917 RepID=A0A9W6LX99_9MICO|nr:hypothetical protein [Microbacterium barkeri]MDI6944203.1 hypothetical protein [Microbacterium barkeri]MDR6876775.1 hypothetical protein [Microbacterium barkeri]GLJ62216.1 hypothetical protein GCM10017576_23460 [Microbacterium barkeri]
MSTVAKANLHWSPSRQRYMKCVAQVQCPYGGAHTSIVGIAEAGGGELSDHGHSSVKIVSPVVDGVFSVGTEHRRQTWKRKGDELIKLTPYEAERWRASLSKRPEEAAIETRIEPMLLPALGWGSAPVRAKPAPRQTNPKDLFLAESTDDAGILAQLAHSPDWNVRLLVARNPATATDTLEHLALATDKHAHLYRSAVRAELGHRYQDERDAEELAAHERMAKDPKRRKWLEDKPNSWILSEIPNARWQRKPAEARRSIVRAALEETAKALRVGLKLAGWTGNKLVKHLTGKDGAQLVRLPHRLVQKSAREVLGFLFALFAASAGDAKAQKRVARTLGFGW